MDLVVTRTAKAHEVAPIMRPSTRHGQNVMHLIHRSEDALLVAPLTKGMRLHVAVSDAFPRSAVLLLGVWVTAVLLVLSRYQLAVFLTVPSIR